MLLIKKISVAFLLILLTGCSFIGNRSFIQNRDTDYLKAKSIPPLQIPPGLASDKISAQYPVSDRNYPTSHNRVNLTPPELFPGN